MTEDQFWEISCLHNRIEKLETLKNSFDSKNVKIYYNTKNEDSYGNFIGDDINEFIGEDNVLKILSDFIGEKLEKERSIFSKLTIN